MSDRATRALLRDGAGDWRTLGRVGLLEERAGELRRARGRMRFSGERVTGRPGERAYDEDQDLNGGGALLEQLVLTGSFRPWFPYSEGLRSFFARALEERGEGRGVGR